MARRKRTGLIQVKLRISGDLKRRLDIEARKREDGSLSAEIADRLEQSFKLPAMEETVATAVVNKLSSLSAEIADRLQSFKPPAMEETVATAVVNKLSNAGWGPPTSGPKK
jgi:hypothetical protein